MTALEIIHRVGLGGAVLIIALGASLGLIAEAGRRRRGTLSREWPEHGGEIDRQYILEHGPAPELAFFGAGHVEPPSGRHRRPEEAPTEPLDMRGELGQ